MPRNPLSSPLPYLSLSLLAALSFLFVAPSALAAQVLFLDDFDDETIGTAPVSPNTGTYSIYPNTGAHTVENPDGNGDLRLQCSDGSGSTSCNHNFQPTTAPTQRSIAEFIFRINSGFGASGFANDFTQQLVLLPLGNNILLEWAGLGTALGVRIYSGGAQQTQFFIANFAWAADTDYFIEIEVDPVANTYSIYVDSQLEASGTINAGFTAIDRLILKSGSATTGVTLADDIVITELPEPSATATTLAALLSLGVLRRRRASRVAAR